MTESRWVQTLTVTAQHTSILRQQGRNETPRQAFITDLCQFITNQHSQGNGVLLAGDYTEELEITYDVITKLCSDFHIIDLNRSLIYGILLGVLWLMYHAWITYGTVERIL